MAQPKINGSELDKSDEQFGKVVAVTRDAKQSVPADGSSFDVRPCGASGMSFRRSSGRDCATVGTRSMQACRLSAASAYSPAIYVHAWCCIDSARFRSRFLPGWRAGECHVEQLITQARIEAIDEAVCERIARPSCRVFSMQLRQPFLHGFRKELGAIVGRNPPETPRRTDRSERMSPQRRISVFH